VPKTPFPYTGGAFRFFLTIFLSAFLLFQVQPMMGRYVLPWFGGGPAVWTTCMLFFQVVLVAGYAYAHWLGSRVTTRLQSSIHLALLAGSLLFLPLAPRAILARQAVSDDPSGRILLVLAVTIGGPYFMLSATGPLLQRWFHLSQPGRSPWRLYSLSNFGSFLALLSYPFAIEPFLRLQTQAWMWTALYAGFVLLCGWTAWTMRSPQPPDSRLPAPDDSLSSPPPTFWTIAFWIGLAACGSTLLLATTNLICQDIAVIPFLWVAPLSIYLLTFVIAFESDRWYHRAGFATAAGVLVPAGCVVTAAAIVVPPWWQIGVGLVALFVACMVGHGELARSRPQARYLTTFYLSIAAGGGLGGVFVALVCPHVFREFSEYPIGLAAACLLGFVGWMRTGAFAQWTRGRLAVRIPLMALLIGGMTAVATAVMSGNPQAVARWRNFYGILRVTESAEPPNGPSRRLTHGLTVHGMQFLNPPQRTWPTTYYGPHSGVGIVLNALRGGPRRVAVIGLGAGTIAAWGRSGDTFRFYEINPDVFDIAHTWFSYLKDTKATIEPVLGDARVQLERELASDHAGQFDVIAVDAFSSDAIPMHLLTAECGDIYRRHLAPGGLLLFHISNRLLKLDPVTRGLARHLGWEAVRFLTPRNDQTGESVARWVLMTANTAFLEMPEIGLNVTGWGKGEPPPIAWTDDFASLWHVLSF
jgi:SAM-dependent methyltransferase